MLVLRLIGVKMPTEDQDLPENTTSEHKRVLKWYIQRCKELEKENEKLKEKVSAFYGI